MQPVGAAAAPVGAVPQAVRGLVPRTVALAMTVPGDPTNVALPTEQACIPRARAARRADFAAGRSAARAAMADLGAAPVAVPVGDGGAPVWPEGLTGSVAHCRTACLAAVALRRDVAALGVDVEEDSPLDPDLFDTICTASERAWLRTQPADRAGRLAKLVFCIKEAAYKCQYPLTGKMLDFHDFEVEIAPDQDRFTARFLRDAGRFRTGTALPGRYAFDNGLIVAAAILAAHDAA